MTEQSGPQPRTDEDVPFTHRFVATDRTRRQLAGAWLRWFYASPRSWLLLALFLAFFALLMFSGMDDRFSSSTRAVWSVVYGIVPTLLVAAVIGAMIYVRVVRGARIRVHAGAVLESGFGEHTLALRNPVESSRQDYRTIRWIKVRGDHVFIRRVGLAPVAVWPRALFPDEEIERVRRATGR